MNPSLVHVEWQDARSVDAWTAAGEIDITPAGCRTVGFLIRTTPDTIAVAGSLEGENACCVMVIPCAMVTKMRVLSIGGEWQTGLGDSE